MWDHQEAQWSSDCHGYWTTSNDNTTSQLPSTVIENTNYQISNHFDFCQNYGSSYGQSYHIGAMNIPSSHGYIDDVDKVLKKRERNRIASNKCR